VEVTSASLRRLKVRQLPDGVSKARLDYVIELVHGYVKDSKHYADKRKPVTSLACIAYAEGLLDAMKFLELVEF
jgi:FAD synthetase